MTSKYCPLPFREVVLFNGDILQPCCQNHAHKVFIKDSFDQSFNTGVLEQFRNQLLSGQPVKGCDQCYNEEAAGVESMRQRSINRYGYVDKVEIHAIQMQFDNLCNLKCRMCASTNSHMLYEDEIEVLGKTINPKKFILTTRHNEIDKTHLKEIKFWGGEPLISPRAQEFFKDFTTSGEISQVVISTYTNGMITPSGYILEAFEKCRYLDLFVSIDAYGGLNEYIRGKSNFDDIVNTLNFLRSLMKSRPPESTFIGVSTLVNIYNVNKLQDLDSFIKKEFPEFGLEKKFLFYPEFLRISSLPAEYKNKIRSSVEPYPEVLKFLDNEDTEYFDEFIFYSNSIDKLRQESLKEVNPELYDFMKSYKSKKQVKQIDLQKLYPQIDL